MKRITYFNDKPYTFMVGDFLNIYDENDYILFVGESAEIKALYRVLLKHDEKFCPVYTGDFPKFNAERMYGIEVKRMNHGFSYEFNVVGESAVCRFLYEVA